MKETLYYRGQHPLQQLVRRISSPRRVCRPSSASKRSHLLLGQHQRHPLRRAHRQLHQLEELRWSMSRLLELRRLCQILSTYVLHRHYHQVRTVSAVFFRDHQQMPLAQEPS